MVARNRRVPRTPIFTSLLPEKITLRFLVATFLAVLELTRLAKLRILDSDRLFVEQADRAVHRLAGKACVMHTHMPYATALTLTDLRALDTTLSQNAMRFHGRVAVDAQYNGLALDVSEGERIARAMDGADVVFLGNHGVIVCGERISHAFDDLYYLERACQAQVLAHSTGRPLLPVQPELAARVAAQTMGERLQSELFFESLRRMVR